MKKRSVSFLLCCGIFAFISCPVLAQQCGSPMTFNSLATLWDEAIPMGNSTIGSLVWQKGDNLRISIDRVDLWDLRSHDELSADSLSFDWVYESVLAGDYAPVQRRYDYPYDNYPGPSKIPGAGIEIPLAPLGSPCSVSLDQSEGICEVVWASGTTFRCFIHALEPFGYFVFENAPEGLEFELVAPSYNEVDANGRAMNDQSGSALKTLGYAQGAIEREGDNKLVYTQPCWGDFSYKVALRWKRSGDRVYGVWSASSSLVDDDASQIVDRVMEQGIAPFQASHGRWWSDFYSKSSVTLPDKTIQEQYYKEIYKMGSISREDSYPISLQ
ncbi:MAG: hypothetical protein R3Y19_06245, partial [Rikenellaceae bacterium]